jgi:hypothetical protein
LRELNFGFRASFTLFAVVAIFPLEQLLAFSYQLLALSLFLAPLDPKPAEQAQSRIALAAGFASLKLKAES